MKQKLTMQEEATLALETLLAEYNIESINEEAVNIFFGDYILLKVQWAIEFITITFLFIFAGVFLWTWTPSTFELKTALKVVLELGLFCSYRYIWSNSYDKKAVDTTKKFVALANRYPNYFTMRSEEDPENGNEGNADKE